MMIKTFYSLSALALAALIGAESNERYDIRKPMTRPALRITQPIMTQPKLSCQRCVQRCLFDDDDAVNVGDDTAANVGDDMTTMNIADAANEKFNWSPRGYCRQCINQCAPRMCARMGFVPLAKRIVSRADSHQRRLMEEAKDNEAQTEWGWGGWGRGFGGWGGWGRGFGWGGWW